MQTGKTVLDRVRTIGYEVIFMKEGKEKRIIPDEFGKSFLNGEFSTIYQQTSKDFKQLVILEQFIELGESFNLEVKQYNLEMSNRLGKHIEQFLWLDNEREKAISVAFDEDYTIQSLLLAPFVSYPESDNRYTENTYILPIKEEWFVFWGGTNQFINYHYVYETQRYAYDLVIMKDGQSYRDAPTKNENYYAFNKEIVAPFDGEVVKVIEGVKDNVPGEMDESQPEGNCVVIRHPNNEYSMLAHLKQNSILVKVGDHVQQGQVIGLCGNSGNSSEPHLHFQVMDSFDYYTGKSIRIQLEGSSEPIQGEVVRPYN